MRKQTYKFFPLLLILAFIMAVIAGCGAAGSGQQAGADNREEASPKQAVKEETIELRMVWWGSQNRHDRTLKAIDLFQQQHPNIKIAPEFTGWDGYWEKLATQAAGKNLPDIIQMDMQYIGEYVSRGLLENLNPYVESGVLDLSDVDEKYLSGGRVDGNLFSVNAGANALAMAVDSELYKKAGLSIPEPGYTWEDFMEQARVLKQSLGSGGYVKALSGGHEFRHYLRQHGETLYNEDGTALGYEEDQYLIDFLTMWDTLNKEGVIAPPEVEIPLRSRLEDELIVHGKAPNHFFHSNQIIALTAAAERPLELVIYPSVEGGEKGHYLKPSQFLAVTTHSKHAEAAAAFIDFFTNSLEANEILAAERGVPVAAKVREHLYPTLDDASKRMFEYMDQVAEYAGEVPVDAPGAGAVFQAFDRAKDAMSYGQLTPEEAAASFRGEANKILAKNKK
jgi:multiple sugar transport system substrate-binding protein